MRDATTSTRKPRWGRRIALAGLGVLLVLALLLVGLRLFAKTGWAGSIAEQRIEALEMGGQRIEVDGLTGDLLSEIRIEGLQISDEDGVWLRAERLRLDWTWADLLSRRLQVDQIGAERIEIIRRPLWQSPQTEKDQTGGGSPLRAYRIEALRIEDLVLREGLARREVLATLTGRLDYSEKDLSGRLDLVSRPEQADRLLLEVDWRDGEAPSLVYEIEGQAGGLIATLAGLGAQHRLDGAGRIGLVEGGQVSGTARIAIDGGTLLDLRVDPKDARQVSVTGTLYPTRHPGLPGALAALEQLDLVAQADPRDLMTTLDLSISGSGVALNANSLPAGGWSVLAEISALERFLAVEDFGLARLTYSGKVALGEGVRLDGLATVSDLRHPQAQLARAEGPVRLSFSGSQVSGRIDLSGRGLRVPALAGRPDLARPRIQAEFSGTPQEVRFDGFTLSATGAELSGQGTLKLQDGPTLTAHGGFDVSGAVLGVSQLDRTQAKWRVSGGLAQGLKLALDGRATAAQDIAALEPVAYLVDLTVREGGRVDLSQLDLSQGTRRVSASGRYAPSDGAQLSVKGDLPDLALDGLTLQGASADLALDLQGDRIFAEGRAGANEIVIGGETVSDLSLNIGTLDREAGRVRSTFELEAVVRGEALTSTASVTFDEAARRVGIETLTAHWGGLTATAQGVVPLQALRETDLSVKLNGTGETGLPVGEISLDARVQDEQARGRLWVRGLNLASLEQGEVDLNFEGDLSRLAGNLTLSGDLMLEDRIVPVGFAGPVTAKDVLAAERALTLDGAGKLGFIALEISEPLTVSRSASAGWLADGALRVADSEVSVALSEAADARARLVVDGVTIAPVLEFFGQVPRDGEARMDLSFQAGPGGRLVGGGAFAVTGLRALDGQVSDFALEGDLALDGEVAKVNVREVGLEDLRFSAQTRLPLAVDSESLVPEMAAGAPLTFSVSADGRIDPLSDLFLPATTAMGGVVEAQFDGTRDASGLTYEGRMTLQDGRFEQAGLGIALTQLRLDATLDDRAVRLASLSAQGVKGGTLTGRGEFVFGALGESSSVIDVETLRLLDREVGRAVASGTIRLIRQDGRPTLSGELRIVEALLDLEQLPKSGPPTLDVRFEDPEETGEEEVSEQGLIGLDLTLTSERGIKVQGRGADALMGVELRLSNSLVAPQISGRARLVRGRFDLLGKRFELTPSTIEIADPVTASVLDLSATRQSDGYEYVINVSGTVERPQINLRSTPELPEDEVLSRVLFGRSPSQLSSLEAARLAAAIAQLSGGGGFDLLGGLEAQLGLDRLSVDVGDTGSTSLVTGKYLAEDVYVEVDTGIAGVPGLSIEWVPLEQLEVEAQTVPDEGQTLSIKWKRDFD